MSTQVAHKFSTWIGEQKCLPYRFRKSIIKKINPSLLQDYPFEVDFFGMKYSGNLKDYISRIVFFCGAYEKYMLFFFRDFAKNLNRDDLVFVDVGANVGNHSLFMSQHVSKVYAFEPYELVRGQLEEKIRVNKVKNIKVSPIGLSNKEEEIPFYGPPNSNLGSGSFDAEHSVQNNYISDLKVVVGDKEVKKQKIKRIDIIKMDVEGHERYVLEGLKESLEKHRPLVVLELSITTRNKFKNFEDFKSVFPKDYEFLRFSKANRDSGKYNVSSFEYTEDYKRDDVIACPVEKQKYINN